MSAPEINSHPEGVILSLKVSPKARKNGITGTHDGQLKVSVTAVPEKGKANTAVLKLLATKLQTSRSQLEIIRGETSPQKQLLVREMTSEELSSR
ncbi:MAG: YggU family protein, partial [Planctomycetaceae bacterium]|nr:YggU family protein [Planctomycetaceae bacterium]